MRKKVLVLLLGIAALSIPAVGGSVGASAHRMPTHFMVKLTGGHETPKVHTDARGFAFFHLSKDGKTLHYVIKLRHITGVMGIHIHWRNPSSTTGGGMSGGSSSGMGGMSGMHAMTMQTGMSGMGGGSPAMIAMLYSSETGSGPVDGTLVEGDLTSSDLMGPLAGHPLSDFVAAAMQHELYVQVHTMEFKSGQVSGIVHRG